MADSQHAAGKGRYRRGRHTAASENHDWEPRRGESRHSLPHRTRQPEIQRPDRRKPKYSTRPSRTSEDLADIRSMPAPVRLLTRPATPKSRGRRPYDEDDDDDDDDIDSEKERLRGRLRSRSRPAWGGKSAATSRVPSRVTSRAKSRVKSRPTSRGSQSTDSSPFPTPTRSSFAAPMRSAPSAPSIGAMSSSSSDDSDDESDSTRDYRMKTRTLKERMNGTPDSEPIPTSANRSQSRPNRSQSRPNRSRSRPNRSQSRHKSHERIVPEIESPAEDSEDQAASRPRLIVKKRSLSRHRQAQQSRSRSRAPRPQRRSDRNGEHTGFSPKRAPKNYYDSDGSYSREPSFSRSRATSASRVKSAKSAGSSSRQSLANFFQTSGPPQPYNGGPKSPSCVVCREGISAKKRLAKLDCGHRWCNSCLKRRFKVSIDDAQSMPPRCCTSEIIPLSHVNDLFNDDFKRTWNDKFARFSARDRNYCPRAKCREWIRPADHRHHSNGRTSATCRKCETKICGMCYNKWHESKRCPADADTAQFLKVAKEAGWKRCYNCQAMVELKEGCNHMTCRCGAQFCMICGLKWKGCECPYFNYQLDEQDELGRVPIPIPMVSRERLGGTDGLPRSLRPDLAYAHDPRRHRGHPMEDRTRHLQHHVGVVDDEEDEEDDDDDDDYLDNMGGAMGIGNPAGHFLEDDYRRRSHGMAVPPAPLPNAPLPPHSVSHERNKSGGNYVSGVNKARGVRGSSMERRLADRFSEQRQTFNPHHRPFGQPPLTAPPLSMGHPPHQPPMVPSPISRRHTMDNDMYDAPPFDPRYAQHAIPRRATAHTYMDDFAIHAPMGGRRRYRAMEPPKPSELAGLTGPASGMNRVYEWANHVETYPGDNQTVA